MIIGIGIDAVEIDRVAKMYERLGDRLLERVFSAEERHHLRSKRAPAQHMAVRLAAKEAAYKALSGNSLARGIGWREVEVVSRDDGSPRLLLHGNAAARFAELDGTHVHVSLTHSLTTAVAVVIVER
ncbi:MAG TPA: holo-ACP synthase [Gemmatimonadaceae bacterium]